jgi:FHA domain-containing protein
MNVLKSVETTIANLVEGAFGRLFRSEVRPIELARKLAREMDEHRTTSVSRVYAPNEYAVWLSPQDRARYEGVEHEVIDELCAYLLEHARREELILPSRPIVTFHTDERLALGEFGIQAQLVRSGGQSAREEAFEEPEAEGTHGETMIYSSSARVRGEVEGAQATRRSRALVTVGGRRLPVPARGATLGRSRDCDIVLDDSSISRRHAEIRPAGDGWTVADLGSTNGVRLNGRPVEGAEPLQAGDRVELGSTEIGFELG